MRIGYVPRFYRPSYYDRRYALRSRLGNRLKNRGVHALAHLRRKLYFSPIDGFFEEALYHAGDVTQRSYRNLQALAASRDDAVVVHFRAAPGRLRGEDDELVAIARACSGTKALFIDADEAAVMKDDRVLDCYDVVFKREPFADPDRYPVAMRNRDKIRPTMLSCPYFQHSPYRALSRRRHVAAIDAEAKPADADVFFIGKATDARLAAWRTLATIPGIRRAGGLLPRIGFDNDPDLMTSPLDVPSFISHLKTSRISLAVDGHGEFTFRHLEIWCAGGFLLASSSLREISLPIDAREGEHFECYDDLDDLREKVAHYATRPDRCREIAANGKKLFDSQYDTGRHGQDILKALGG